MWKLIMILLGMLALSGCAHSPAFSPQQLSQMTHDAHDYAITKCVTVLLTAAQDECIAAFTKTRLDELKSTAKSKPSFDGNALGAFLLMQGVMNRNQPYINQPYMLDTRSFQYRSPSVTCTQTSIAGNNPYFGPSITCR